MPQISSKTSIAAPCVFLRCFTAVPLLMLRESTPGNRGMGVSVTHAWYHDPTLLLLHVRISQHKLGCFEHVPCHVDEQHTQTRATIEVAFFV